MASANWLAFDMMIITGGQIINKTAQQKGKYRCKWCNNMTKCTCMYLVSNILFQYSSSKIKSNSINIPGNKRSLWKIHTVDNIYKTLYKRPYQLRTKPILVVFIRYHIRWLYRFFSNISDVKYEMCQYCYRIGSHLCGNDIRLLKGTQHVTLFYAVRFETDQSYSAILQATAQIVHSPLQAQSNIFLCLWKNWRSGCHEIW